MCLSYQFIAFQLCGKPPVPGAEALQERVELRPMVHVLQVAEFVEDNIITQFRRNAHQVEIEVYVPVGRAASPVRDIVLDEHAIVFEAMFRSQFGHPSGQERLGFGAEPLHFRGYRELAAPCDASGISEEKPQNAISRTVS